MGLILDNPITGKELKSSLRSGKALILALVYVSALSLLALAQWPAEGINPEGGLVGRAIFTTVLAAQLALLLLFAPPFAATCVTEEKDANTYESLYCTHLSAASIVLGKLAGAVGYLLILVLLSLPVGAVCMMLGGVEPGEFFLAHLVLAMAGIMFGLIGVTFSALMRRSFNALVGTYVALLVLCGLVQLPYAILGNWTAGLPWMHALRSISPFSAIFAVSNHAFQYMGPEADRAVVMRFVAFFFVSSAGLLALAIVGARLSVVRPPRSREKAISGDAPMSQRIMRRIFFVIDPRRRKRWMPLYVNPVLLLEFRARTASLSNMLRALFACMIFSVGLIILVFGPGGPDKIDEVRLIAISFQFGLIVLLAPTLTVGAISSEFENRTMDSLRVTSLGAWRILLGKLEAALVYSVMLLITVLPPFFVTMFIREKWVTKQILAVVLVSAATILVALTMGLMFSSLCRRTASAAALTYGFLGGLVVATGLAVVMGERLHPTLLKAILSFNPVISVVAAVSDDMFVQYYDIWKWNVVIMCCLSALALATTAWRLHKVMEPTE